MNITIAWDGPGYYPFEGSPSHGTRISPRDIEEFVARGEVKDVWELASRQGRGTPEWLDEPPADVRVWPEK